jgi:pimeloyl-ACP methyl ester carboxylesterase
MIKVFGTVIAICFFNTLFAQNNDQAETDTTYNFGFENVSPNKELPDKWVKFNPPCKGYKCETTTTEKHGGERSLLIEQVGDTVRNAYASIVNVIPAKYAGKEIEFKAYLKFVDVTQFVGIMIRIIDANETTVQFKSLQQQHIKGTKDWTLYTVKVPIPVDAQTVYVAAILGGPGRLWVDDAQVLIDGKDIGQAKINPGYNPHPILKPVYGSNAKASGRVKLKTATLYYETYGSGKPLLLLHGNSQSILAFKYQIDDLSKKYKVIAVDTRGQGKSTDETTGPLSYDLFAEDMRQLLDSLHIAKTDVLGWSDGGNTGLTMAVKYPAYINKLAITGANLFPTNDAIADTVWKQVRQGITDWSLQTDAHSKMEVRLLTMLLNEPHLAFDDIKKIQAPVLVMAGQHDLILEKHTRAIAAAIPNSKLVIFKGASHYVPVDVPRAFNAIVLKFFDQQ